MFPASVMSGSARVAPSPVTSAHEEHDTSSNLSWPSTPVRAVSNVTDVALPLYILLSCS